MTSLFGGGSSTNIQPAVDATRESNELLEQIYNESVARGQPYYEGGTQGFNTLLDYMGLQGGNAGQSEQQIRDSLTGQYTIGGAPQTLDNGLAQFYSTRDGEVISGQHLSDSFQTDRQYLGNYHTTPQAGQVRPYKDASFVGSFDTYEAERGFTPDQTLRHLGYTPVGDASALGAGGGEIDQAGLDAAVQAQLAEQEANRPEYFGSLMENFDASKMQDEAGYQFRQQEGQKALERRLAAQGKTFSPEAAKALMGYNQGLASQEYQQSYNRYGQDQSNAFNRLASIAGIGQQQNSINAGLGQSYGTNVSSNLTGLANTQMAAQQADAANRQSMFGSLLGTGASLASVAFSDSELKENIEKVGSKNGFNTYTFNYKGDDTKYKGVMAQEVMETNPEAVKVVNGHYAVNYDMLGLEMETV